MLIIGHIVKLLKKCEQGVTSKLVGNLEKPFEYGLHFNNNVLNLSDEIITFFKAHSIKILYAVIKQFQQLIR